jgi:hypothetical protein
MTSENLVTIDFDTDSADADQDAEINAKSSFNSAIGRQKILEEPEEIIFSGGDSNLDEILVSESQPLLGSGDHETHQIIYNQFPSKFC